MDGVLGPLYLLAVVGITAAFVYFAFIWPIAECYRRPAGDIPRLKRNLDGEPHRVIEVTPLGGSFTVSRGGATGYRRYSVVVEFPNKIQRTRLIDLQPSLFGDSRLWEVQGNDRRPLAYDL